MDSKRAWNLPRLGIYFSIALIFVPGIAFVAAPGAVHARLQSLMDAQPPHAAQTGEAGEALAPLLEATQALYTGYEERTTRAEKALIVILGLLYLGFAGRWLLERAERQRRQDCEARFSLHLHTLIDGVQAVESTSNPDEVAPRMEVLAAARRRAEQDWHAGLLSHDEMARLYSIYQAGGWAATQRMTRLYFYELQNQGDQLLAAAHPRPVPAYEAGEDDFFAQPFSQEPAAQVPAPAPAPAPSPPEMIPRELREPTLPEEPEPEQEHDSEPDEPVAASSAAARPLERPWYLDDAPTLGEAGVDEPPPSAAKAPRVGVVDYTYSDDEQWDSEDDPQVTEGIIGRPIVRRRATEVEAPAPRVEYENPAVKAPESPAPTRETPTPPAESPASGSPTEEDGRASGKQKSGKRAGKGRAPKQRGGRKGRGRANTSSARVPPVPAQEPEAADDSEEANPRQMDLGF